jgi:DNA-binding protein Alba
MSDYEDVYIGSKPIPNYLTAGIWALGQNKPVRLLGRGGNIKTTVDVAEILKRQMVDPVSTIEIGSEEFNDRKVSTITIVLVGKRKEKDKE